MSYKLHVRTGHPGGQATSYNVKLRCNNVSLRNKMFWADKLSEEIKASFQEKIDNGFPLIIRDEKTMSGRVHFGSLRSFVLHGMIAEVLEEQKILNKFFFEINDFDPMDALPVNLDHDKYRKYMGMPLVDIPAPDGKYKNYAEYFAEEYIDAIHDIGFKPQFYRSSGCYSSGKYNGVIKIALERAEKIRKIYKEASGSVKVDTWLPIHIICPNCGKISTTEAFDFDGATVGFRCEREKVEWAEGCGEEGRASPFDGKGKMPWKVEWAAKFKSHGVHVEGAGKDHFTKGGSRDVADRICREIFEYEPPFGIPHEFILVGGRKMSSSKGDGSSAREMTGLLPKEVLRFFLIYKEPIQTLDFIPDGDTIPALFDTYDKYGERFFSRPDDDYARIFYLAHTMKDRKDIKKHFLPRFSQVAFIIQMPHISLQEEVKNLKGSMLTDVDYSELERRAKYAKFWLDKFAPDEYRFELQSELPELSKNFSSGLRRAFKKILSFLQESVDIDGRELHTYLHEVRKEFNLEPAEFFGALYMIFLGKNYGPKAGWFLSALDKDFVIKRIAEVV